MGGIVRSMASGNGNLSAADPSVPMPTAVVVAGDDQTRVLFRGLLRLHHFHVVGETGGSTEGDELVRHFHPTVLVADASLSEGSLSALVPATRDRSPETRIIVVQPAGKISAFAEGEAPDATLTRPFRVKDFVDAITAIATGRARAASPEAPR